MEMESPNLITFQDWCFLKNTADLTKGVKNFTTEELDNIVVFYDENKDYLDYIERKKVEDITPAYVLVPKFFWEHHQESIKEEFYPELKANSRLQTLDKYRQNYFNKINNDMNVKKHYITATPREEQNPVLDKMYGIFQNQKRISGIIQAIPGFGKTAVSVFFAGKLKTKTLIIVPNEILQEQWQQSILDFTNLSIEDIGILQGSDIKNLEPMLKKDICVIKIQSLLSQLKTHNAFVLQELYKDFGLVFYDEAHTSGGAVNYSKTSSLFKTPNIIGLTATPYRDGINDYMLKIAIGDLIYKAEHQNLIPDIEIHKVYTPFKEQEVNRLKQLSSDYNMMLGVFNSIMKGKQDYFDYLADVVIWNLNNKHNIAVLFPTIALMEKLKKAIETRHPTHNFKILLLKGKTKQDSLDMVKAKRKELMEVYKSFKQSLDLEVKEKKIKRKEANLLIKERRVEIDKEVEYLKENAIELYRKNIEDCDAIVSNYNILSAGFSKDRLDNVIFGGAPRIGKIVCIQSIGRATRTHPGKGTPLIQYFIPSAFFELNKSTNVILSRNIKVQYPTAKFKYIGFQDD
jgi:superfamily II DNA or RNA helicase